MQWVREERILPAHRYQQPRYGDDPTPQAKAPLAVASLVLGSRGALVPPLKSVAAVFRFRSGDQRPISRDAAERNAHGPIGVNYFAAALMAAPVCCYARQAALVLNEVAMAWAFMMPLHGASWRPKSAPIVQRIRCRAGQVPLQT
jgi:hypothetical protein